PAIAPPAAPVVEPPEARAATTAPPERRRGGRQAAIIAALVVLALFVAGSDWFFYRQFADLHGQERAWLGPQSARSERPPAVGKPFEVAVFAQNTGREPAGDVAVSSAPLAVSLDEAASAVVDRKL